MSAETTSHRMISPSMQGKNAFSERLPREVGRAAATAGCPSRRSLKRAGMSRKTFYELFENREDCFLQAFDACRAARADDRRRRLLHTRLADAARPRRAWAVGLPRPLRGRARVRPHVPRRGARRRAAGARAARRGRARLRPLHRVPREEARGQSALSLVSEAIAGGIYGILYTRVARGETALLPSLLDELMDAGIGQLVDQDD